MIVVVVRLLLLLLLLRDQLGLATVLIQYTELWLSSHSLLYNCNIVIKMREIHNQYP